MRSMEDYRFEAAKLVVASYGDSGYKPTVMCQEASETILELIGEVERLRGKLTKKRRKFKRDFEIEYATMSPNSKHHAKLQTFNFGDSGQELKMAKKFADMYREVEDDHPHKDTEAAAVWRYVGPYNFVKGYEPQQKEEKSK